MLDTSQLAECGKFKKNLTGYWSRRSSLERSCMKCQSRLFERNSMRLRSRGGGGGGGDHGGGGDECGGGDGG